MKPNRQKNAAALAGATAAGEKTTRSSDAIFVSKDSGIRENCQAPFPLSTSLATEPVPPITDAALAWKQIVHQLNQVRPNMVIAHQLSSASCRLERGRLVVTAGGSAPLLRQRLLESRARPLAVAALLAGLGTLDVEFIEK